MPTTVTEATAAWIHKIMSLAFEKATVRHPHRLQESFYQFGGQRVRIRIVGREMATHITRPFSHLRADVADTRTPQLTVDLWDESETGVHCQVSPLNGGRQTPFAALAPDGRFLAQQRPNVLNYYDRSGQNIISSVAWSGEVSVYERWKPLGRALLEWYNNQDVQIVHAGLVARDNEGVLFVGPSGSGKSTSALACLCGGFSFLGEDYIGLQKLEDGSFVGHSLYNSVFLENNHLTRFPRLAPYIMTGLPHEEKSAIVLSQIYPEKLARTVPIRALMLPRVIDTSKPTIRPASKSEAVSLGARSLLELPHKGLGRHGLERLVKLVQNVPCYWLELGRELSSIPSLVEDILIAAVRSWRSPR